MRIAVEGGTGAGVRYVKQLPSWTCRCIVWFEVNDAFGVPLDASRQHPGDRYSCGDCGARRPT